MTTGRKRLPTMTPAPGQYGRQRQCRNGRKTTRMTNGSTNQACVEYKTDYTLLTRTAAKWSIPRDLAMQVIKRDLQCVYCRHIFAAPYEGRKTCPSWEHIVNDPLMVSLENIALCCGSCNSSKGKQPLRAWLTSAYCEEKGITERTIAMVALTALQKSKDDSAQQHILLDRPG